MKKYSLFGIYYLCVALVGLVFLNGCDDESDDVRLSDVPVKVSDTFNEMFPGVTVAEWEKDRGYYVADFWYQSAETHAWFAFNGEWRMTETDLGRSLTNLPEAVQAAFNGSQYATWRVDDIDKYVRQADTFYLIEVETNGQRDRDLFFAPDGSLLKDEVHRDSNKVLPDTDF